jgi:hypothetical protein
MKRNWTHPRTRHTRAAGQRRQLESVPAIRCLIVGSRTAHQTRILKRTSLTNVQWMRAMPRGGCGAIES